MTTRNEFIRSIASMTLEGEPTDDQPDGFEWENDDAWATVERLIMEAREILEAEEIDLDAAVEDVEEHGLPRLPGG